MEICDFCKVGALPDWVDKLGGMRSEAKCNHCGRINSRIKSISQCRLPKPGKLIRDSMERKQ